MRRLRKFSLLPLFILLSLPSQAATTGQPSAEQAAGVKIVRILEGHKKNEDFDRISEFFSGKENTGGVTILRSQPSLREGYYFTIRLDSETPVTKATIELLIYNTVSETPHRHTFETTLSKGSQLIEIGLTGNDWPFPKTTHPSAWKITLLDAAQTPLATRQSYLW